MPDLSDVIIRTSPVVRVVHERCGGINYAAVLSPEAMTEVEEMVYHAAVAGDRVVVYSPSINQPADDVPGGGAAPRWCNCPVVG